ncbi:hypothetical protein [Neobacillus sp. D3-1R]|uniref:hypothetical protein n=1 Tax=Neobacillus sp. D3-1R TaxID=3445778 RepID=UPI003F9F2991
MKKENTNQPDDVTSRTYAQMNESEGLEISSTGYGLESVTNPTGENNNTDHPSSCGGL